VTIVAILTTPLAGRAQQDSVRQSDFSFTTAGLTLRGTLTLPATPGPWPAAVIIAGSGPTDRNGNSAAGVGANTYGQLAAALAARGIATLRYDKRGLPSSTGTFAMATTTLHDFAADATAAARALAARDDVSKVVLAGHSEGGMLAMLAARAGAPVAGLVLIAAAGRDATTILREQLARQLPPELLAQFDTAWAGYVADSGTYRAPPALQSPFLPVNRRFIQSWQAIDPVALLRSIAVPTIVVQGETDVQVTPADARALGGARSDVRVVLLPGVNHVLKASNGATAQAQMVAYTDPSLPLGPGVVDAIATWILQLPK
jgi:pimeloyl-ACP methyl ester carboxylesterase